MSCSRVWSIKIEETESELRLPDSSTLFSVRYLLWLGVMRGYETSSKLQPGFLSLAVHPWHNTAVMQSWHCFFPLSHHVFVCPAHINWTDNSAWLSGSRYPPVPSRETFHWTIFAKCLCRCGNNSFFLSLSLLSSPQILLSSLPCSEWSCPVNKWCMSGCGKGRGSPMGAAA